MHPIFVIVCRLVSIILALFKLWANYNDQNYIGGIVESKKMKAGKVSIE
jgi:hypothetical protein